jgi:hypothetical protein
MVYPLQRELGSFELYVRVEFVKLTSRLDYIDKEQDSIVYEYRRGLEH